MNTIQMCAPTLFGLEGLTGDELRRLGFEDVRVENGRVYFSGSPGDLAKANLWLRTAERVLVVLGQFRAESFEELFEGVRNIPLEDYIARDGKFPVKGHSIDSKLKSIPDCQAIIKKAAAERLGKTYRLERLPETGAMHQLRFSIMDDRASIYLDSSGAGLHKRGYRALSNDAPLRETIAAGMVLISRYRGRGEFCDPFCGSGTIPIEAALIAKNRAPGLLRTFDFEKWTWCRGLGREARAEAPAREYSGAYSIVGYDKDPAAVELARDNAEKAGVADVCRFEQADVRDFRTQAEAGTLVTNPPYGMRMLDVREAQGLYTALGKATANLRGWGIYVLSADPEFERAFGRRSDKKRKLYNGMIKCEYYMALPKQTNRN